MTSLVAQPSNYIKELLKLKQARGPHLVLFPFPSSACLESFWGNPRVPTEHTLKNLEQMLSLLPASPVILWIYDLVGSESFKTES